MERPLDTTLATAPSQRGEMDAKAQSKHPEDYTPLGKATVMENLLSWLRVGERSTLEKAAWRFS